MKKILLLSVLVSTQVMAYVPSVESLFRHGPNPDISANGVSLTLSVKKMEASSKSEEKESLINETKSEDFYKLFFTKNSIDSMKLAQARYENNSFSEASLLEKHYYSNFTAYTIKGNAEESERGIFFGLLRSIIFNDGAFIVNYLKSLGIPVKLNNEIINRQKVEQLVSYKQYLAAINKDRTNKKNMINPLKPEDAGAKDRADTLMKEPMYVDQKQVKLTNENGQLSWLISAGGFEAVVSMKEREIQRVKFKSLLGEYDIICKDYWLANGTHSVPRFILVKDFKGETYQLEIINMRHYLEKEADLVGRLKKWDTLLKGKTSHDPRPAFLL